MIMLSDTAKLHLEELIANSEEYQEVHTDNDYSGRGMFGQKCLGISGSTSALDMFLIDLVADAPNKKVRKELRDMIKAMRRDQLGLGMIYYFPGFQLPE